MMKKYALLSVTNKSNIDTFASNLSRLGYTILSTGGTAAYLKEAGVSVTDVSDLTKQNEILNGRVKTLHPKVHGSILFDRKNSEHVETAANEGLVDISVVAVNLYEFEKAVASGKMTKETVIEHIDIGGPCMLRAAAKNWQHVLSVIDPGDYERVISKLEKNEVTDDLRLELAQKTFRQVSTYDAYIAKSLAMETSSDSLASDYPVQLETNSGESTEPVKLRYGENPHQDAAFLPQSKAAPGFTNIEVLNGKELSYNNYLDLDAAAGIVREFNPDPIVTIIKHSNPCGTAVGYSGESTLELWKNALSGDPRSAFGGIVATNQTVDKDTAKAMSEIFLECIIAPEFDGEALALLKGKKSLRLLKARWLTEDPSHEWTFRSIQGGTLVQKRDPKITSSAEWKVVSQKKPTESEMRDLVFAFKLASHVKSNTIVYARDGVSVSVGAGQTSRIDAAEFSAERALKEGKMLSGAVMASDAFFPFRDCVDLAAKYGITAVVQPGGSIRDSDSIAAANEHGIAMVTTGERHFRH